MMYRVWIPLAIYVLILSGLYLLQNRSDSTGLSNPPINESRR